MRILFRVLGNAIYYKETKAAVRDFLQQAVDKKFIDKSWLDTFDKGELTAGDFEGLKIIISQR
ncbi:hypothetical protein [Lysinibacillus xylanilyticus]|uniref:hypothetical protein n=1 Tax=Lysinibacillus xylanilyticus TaxID=582475 RepID=UPI003D07EFF0